MFCGVCQSVGVSSRTGQNLPSGQKRCNENKARLYIERKYRSSVQNASLTQQPASSILRLDFKTVPASANGRFEGQINANGQLDHNFGNLAQQLFFSSHQD